jgi:hypothetical protein
MMFACDPFDRAAGFASEGFAAWRAGVSEAFVVGARAQVDEVREQLAQRPFVEHEFALPEPSNLAEIFAFAAALTGSEADAWTLAECQLKGYGHDVDEAANLHKDRVASELAIGVPLWVPGPSFVVLYPDRARDPNRYVTANDYGARASFRDRPEVALLGVEPRRIASEVADVLAFPGSSVFHGRERAAGIVVLYLKLNRLGLDPSGVDPRTYPRRRVAVSLADVDEPRLLELEVGCCPLLTRVVTERCRGDGWSTVEIAEVAGHKPVILSAIERELLLAVRRPTRVVVLLDSLALARSEAVPALRRLVRAGALDLREKELRA